MTTSELDQMENGHKNGSQCKLEFNRFADVKFQPHVLMLWITVEVSKTTDGPPLFVNFYVRVLL